MIVIAIIHLKLKRKLKINRNIMIAKQLIEPKSIVVVGGSDDIHKPDSGTEPARGGFDFRFWCDGIVYYGLRNAKRDQVQQYVFRG